LFGLAAVEDGIYFVDDSSNTFNLFHLSGLAVSLNLRIASRGPSRNHGRQIRTARCGVR
jgi:hypothetical protein